MFGGPNSGLGQSLPGRCTGEDGTVRDGDNRPSVWREQVKVRDTVLAAIDLDDPVPGAVHRGHTGMLVHILHRFKPRSARPNIKKKGARRRPFTFRRQPKRIS
jgi:hypothetical protein